jgi:16S rRNA (cytosine967-C5)-methyltransferase
MANAILRALLRCRGDVIDCPVEPDPRCFLPIDGGRGRLFSSNVFPDPARRPLDFLVAVTSHPPYLVERWHRRLGPKLCRQVCDAGQRRPSLVLRPNAMRITAAELTEHLLAAGLQAEQIEDNDAVRVRNGPGAAEIEAVGMGLCQPQDSTSQLALRLCSPQPGEVVLDLCAGVGTKSTQAAEMMNDNGAVIATDVDEQKLASIPQSAQRLGLTIIRTTPMDRLESVLDELGPPGLILVDAPCTNTGVLARRPEARYRASHKALTELVAVQRDVLRQAAVLAGPETRIVYATCSIEPEENEDQVRAFCEDMPQWRTEQAVATLPDANRDGGFAAVLVRSE